LRNSLELVDDGFVEVNPMLFGVYEVCQKVHQRNDIVSSTESDPCKCIFAGKDHVAFEWHILLQGDMLALIVEVFHRNSEIDQVYMVHLL
jgi:hypothetical protein